MTQGVLPFKYEIEKTDSGMTAFAGLPLFLDLTHAVGLNRTIEHTVNARTGQQGYTDSQVILSLILLNLAGGESVDDINLLEHDPGLRRLIRHVEWKSLPRQERRVLERRWRKKQSRVLPSPSSIFRFLQTFHDPKQEEKRAEVRQEEKAFIPAASDALKGLYQVNQSLLDFAQRHAPHKTATLDMDATLVETSKHQALRCYQGFQSYQPLNTYWFERGLMVHSQFRDGNVPAGYKQLDVLKESLDMLPEDVKKVNLRSDTAAYQWELLKYCAEGQNTRFGVIDFVIGVDVTKEFKGAVREVPEEAWQPVTKIVNGHEMPTGQEYAEVVYVPQAIGNSKKGPDYRFLAVRERLSEQLSVPGCEPAEQLSLPFPTVELATGMETHRYKLTGSVTNRWKMDGQEVIRWYRSRCGKSEEVHHVMKSELCGGRLPSGRFGENAAWWAIMILALNFSVLMKSLVLGGHWVTKRLKAVRFGLICVAGRVLVHARQVLIRLEGEGKYLAQYLSARARIQEFLAEPGG